MKTITDPIGFIVVKAWPGGAREYLMAFLNKEDAQQFAAKEIGVKHSIYLETCKIKGTFTQDETTGRIA